MTIPMRRSSSLLPLILALSLTGEAHESPTCAATVSELKLLVGDQGFALRWEETTMNDGKPLVVSILERDGSLFLEFVKTREGLWVESAGVVCRSGADLEARFAAGQVRMGPAANWALRYALGNGGKFTLTRVGEAQLRITTRGWNGVFSPKEK